jgi:hypothetical protein
MIKASLTQHTTNTIYTTLRDATITEAESKDPEPAQNWRS